MGTDSVTGSDLVIKSSIDFDPKNPQPGMYAGVPDTAYFSARATNHSTLTEMIRSPAHFRVKRDAKEHKESDAMRLGSLAHMMLFEPDRVTDATIPPPINPRTCEPYGSDTKAWAQYVAEHPGKLIVTPDEWQSSSAMVEAICKNSIMAPVFKAAKFNELVVVWYECDVLCKAKIDALVPGVMCADLKTTLDAEERAFAGKVQSLRYYTQAAFYLMAVESLGMKHMDFMFAVVEKEPPYGTNTYLMGQQFRMIGRSQVHGWLRLVAECQASGNWPCYPEKLIELEPDTWFLARFADGM